jgi:uncharacterized membrane protein YdjX (TVP38/TMEM64 family)
MEISADAMNGSTSPTPAGAVPPRASRSGILRPLIVAAVLIAAVLLIHLTPLRSTLSDVQTVRARLPQLGAWVYPLAIVVVATLLACGIPRLPIHAAGGMIFGFGVGLAVTMVGAILGHYGVFLFIRWGGRDWLLQRSVKARKWAGAMQDQGFVAVLLARQLPAHAMFINIALALSHVTHGQFLGGTAIGLLPEAIPATLIGAGLVTSSLKGSAGYFTFAAAAFAVIWIAGGVVFRAHRARQAASVDA